MQIYRGLEQLPAEPEPSAITIGNFDGVHLGHQKVLSALREQAARYQARSVAVTFDPHPAFVHRPESTPELLTGLGEKLARIKAAGVDAALVLPYNEALYMLSAEEFVSRYFVDALNAAAVVVGHDIHFGRARDGDFTTMVDLGAGTASTWSAWTIWRSPAPTGSSCTRGAPPRRSVRPWLRARWRR